MLQAVGTAFNKFIPFRGNSFGVSNSRIRKARLRSLTLSYFNHTAGRRFLPFGIATISIWLGDYFESYDSRSFTMRHIHYTKSVCTLATLCASSICFADYSNGYAHFGAQSDTIQILGNTVFNQGAFTYEMQIRLDANAPLGHVISEQRDTYEDKTIQLAANGQYIASGTASSYATGNNQGTLTGMPTAQWFHLAYVYDGTNTNFYVNGVLSTTHVSTPYGDNSGSWMSIGMFRYGAGYIATGAYPSFLGDLDWIRISAGAKYLSNFTAPVETQILSDASTQLLLKFNESAGTTVLYDESSNQFQCNLGVAVSPGVLATSPTLGNLVPAPGVSALLALAGFVSRRRRA